MTAQPRPRKDRTQPNTIVQQSMPQAAVSATLPEHFLQETDLDHLDHSEDDLPPPAYGDVYGEIRNEKDGLGTSASVTEDGRVNIHINQLNQRLSRIFTPALPQNVHSAQDSRSPFPCIPPSLGGGKGVPPTPRLNVVIQVVGSRGDVQPFVALGKVLKGTYGHRVRLATHPTFKQFVQKNGLEFFSIGGDPSQLMAFMVKNPRLMPGLQSLISGDIAQRRRDVAEYIQGCWRSCYQPGDGTSLGAGHDNVSGSSENRSAEKPFVADCIIANPPSFAHVHCAEKLGIPLHIMFTMPYSPTQAFPHPLANIQSSNANPQLTNYMSYVMIELLLWQGIGDIINRFRARCLGLEPVSVIWAPGMLQRLKIPYTYCWSPALIPKPNDWAAHVSVSGFYLLETGSSYVPSPDLQAFLNLGSPPVYIGFGSIVLDDPDAMTELIFEVVRKTGLRVLLSKGWGGMGADKLHVPDGVFMLGNVPHDWLFKRVSCVVHHGGAGTTAAAVTAGRPNVIVPFFGDQPFWGAMVAQAGAGPAPIPYKQLTTDNLADAIGFCLKPESMERAKELASKIEAEEGTQVGAQSFHQHLDIDRLRCTLVPSRAAVWRIKRTEVRLSAFAAYTLANANLLDFHDLKPYRPQEYYTDEGPWDPISGGFTAVCRAFGGMAMGLATVTSETFRALPTQSTSKASMKTTTSSTSDNSYDTEDYDMLREPSIHTSKGLGQFATALVQSPMELSMSLTRGCHNVPKLWGDETVRPQEQVHDFKSGVRAVGKEFSRGWYDGVTGLVTQPWKGAQKEGASGFLKGVGKGIGGFIAKPTAGLLSILAFPMKGVQKEMQKLFGNSVHSYIIASRVAQGYDEWLQSSDEEKQVVVDGWKLIQKCLKNTNTDEMMRDILEAHRKNSTDNLQPSRRSSSPSFNSLNSPTQNSEDSAAPGEQMRMAEVGNTSWRSYQETPHGDGESHPAEEGDIRANPSRTHLQNNGGLDHA